MHYWLLQVVYDSINFDSYFISVKGPLKKSRDPILQPTFSCHKNLLPCANVHNISTKVEFFKAKKKLCCTCSYIRRAKEMDMSRNKHVKVYRKPKYIFFSALHWSFNELRGKFFKRLWLYFHWGTKNRCKNTKILQY